MGGICSCSWRRTRLARIKAEVNEWFAAAGPASTAIPKYKTLGLTVMAYLTQLPGVPLGGKLLEVDVGCRLLHLLERALAVSFIAQVGPKQHDQVSLSRGLLHGTIGSRGGE